MFATTAAGLKQSRDGGRTWRAVTGPSTPVLLAWEADGLAVLDGDGRLHASSDGGESWTAGGQLPGSPQAFVAGGGRLYAAVESGIFVSTDRGLNWTLFYRDRGDHR
jgi:hypothetical protein